MKSQNWTLEVERKGSAGSRWEGHLYAPTDSELEGKFMAYLYTDTLLGMILKAKRYKRRYLRSPVRKTMAI